MFYFQVANIITSPTLDPDLELNMKMSLGELEILGWYSIDWGVDYYEKDFRIVKEMGIDGVILRSFDHLFVEEPEAFLEAITTAQKFGLKVGIVIFHPFDERYQRAWGLPIHQDIFADFSANRSWIEEIYIPKLQHLVSRGESMKISYYVYDDMNFGAASNLTTAQYFVNVTLQLTGGKALMLASYPPKGDLSSFLMMKITNWDWYTAPERVSELKESLNFHPIGCVSLGQFLWLHQRTNINEKIIERAYEALSHFDRIEIFTLRYGQPDWRRGAENSILEHPRLIKLLTKMNRNVKNMKSKNRLHIKYPLKGEPIRVNLSRCTFIHPYNNYKSATISEYATRYPSLSYFKLIKDNGRDYIEMRFFGNGSDGINGWFSYRTKLKRPISVDLNTTLIVLFKLFPSMDCSGWVSFVLRFIGDDDRIYALRFIFKEERGDYQYLSNNGTISNVVIGNSRGWRFYQFNIYDIYYMSFSEVPKRISEIWYSIGAEADNEISVIIYVLKVSSDPLMINRDVVLDLVPEIELKEGSKVEISGLNISQLCYSQRIYPSKEVNYIFSPTSIKRVESYDWVLDVDRNLSIIDGFIDLRNYDAKSRIYLNARRVEMEHIEENGRIPLASPATQVNLTVVREYRTPSLLALFLFLALLVLMPLLGWVREFFRGLRWPGGRFSFSA